MSRILIAWELGEGLGHVSRLRPIGERLRDLGHEVSFAIRRPDAGGWQLGRAGFPVYQAPLAHPPKPLERLRYRARTFADILWTAGFGEADRLEGMIRLWDSLLGQIRPELVLSDFSPFLALAIRGRIRHVTLGDGFVMPPAHLPAFPSLEPGDGETIDQAALLDVIAQVCRTVGRSAPPSLPAAVGGDRGFICTIPELDPYAAHRLHPADGPLLGLSSKLAEPDRPAEIFAYLSMDAPQTGTMMSAMIRSGLPLSAYLRDATDRVRDHYRAAGAVIYDGPVPLQEVAGEATIVVHHGGHGTSEQLLAMGRPQVLVPRHLEQMLNARSLERLGTGWVASIQLASEALQRLLLKTASASGMRNRAAKIASRLEASAYRPSIENILADVSARL